MVNDLADDQLEIDGVLATSECAAIQEVTRMARQVAPTDTSVLILGETGTGKEWLAQTIHAWSARSSAAFVKVNCAAIAPGLLESELFGHVKGAFTGATRDRPGRFQAAHGGTLLLDEIGELAPELQAKLLRVLQERTVTPVGSDTPEPADVRVLAAAHVDLERALGDGRFREDLFYRIGVFPLVLVPLRDRLEDVPALCDMLLRSLASRTGRYGLRVTHAGFEKLQRHTWPGNLRELANVLERAAILAPDNALGPDVLDLSSPLHSEQSALASPHTETAMEVLSLDEVQRRHILRVLEITNGRVYGTQGAARLLGVKPSTLQSRMIKLGIRQLPGKSWTHRPTSISSPMGVPPAVNCK